LPHGSENYLCRKPDDLRAEVDLSPMVREDAERLLRRAMDPYLSEYLERGCLESCKLIFT
jgi:hypothetical protein